MSERKWTTEQMQAIKLKGANILVSAAAGSGKTSVLVERIVNKIINDGVDIDKILVVTFTNAAASEMRQRLMDAIYKKIDENPNDENLQRQLMLINKANISTIHSFCLNVIRNNFFEIGISNNFRVADETEIEIMKQEIIEDIFEDEYEANSKDFQDLLEKYTTYRDDTPLKDLIIRIYEFIQSDPFPEKWLNNAVEDYNIEINDFIDTKWGKIVLNQTEEDLKECKEKLQEALQEVDTYPDLIDNATMLRDDLAYIEKITLDSWNNIYQELNSKTWKAWQGRKKVDEESKEARDRAKDIRNLAKENFENSRKLFKYTSEENINDIKSMYKTLKALQNIVLKFSKEFSTRKREKNLVDFNDIEHLALKILVDENGNPTEIAKKYDFNEIEIDEYQDSNSVQEYILNSVSNGHNIFMVGDVKQSIYKFRQANPKLFMQKYNEYKLPTDELKDNTKILLYKNFRSRKNILDITNLVFENIMSKKSGEIEYTDEEALNLGANFDEPTIDCTTELNIIETNEEVDENNEDTQEVIENAALEARLVAEKIQDLKKQGIPYKNMTILLRSPKSVASIYEKELMEKGIPVFSDITTEYLNTIEIDTIMSLLKIIDNPLQDIPLVTVLRSIIGGFTDNDLIEIRLVDKNVPYYRALEKAKDNKEIKPKVKEKVEQFLELLKSLKDEEKNKPLDELIWDIYSKTGYYHYVGLMPDGTLRQANLKKLFEKARDYEKISLKGLFNFIIFMEKVGTSSNNLEAARIIGENDDVVRIMSIHKSKGLEFPIVFLCGTSKRFNLRDTSEKIVLDNNLGIGANCFINGANYSTIAKEAIKIKADKESISEEMRVLYVALTRAKDKLIIVGTSNNTEKKLQDKGKEIDKYYKFVKPKKINSRLVGKYKTYLDWLELVYEYNKDSYMKLNIINKSELTENSDKSEENEIRKQKAEIIEEINQHKVSEEEYKKTNDLLNYTYKYEKDIDLPTKTSVTALKELQSLDVNIEQRKIPAFAKQEEITGARKGTIIHLILSKITNEKNISEVEKLIDDLYNKNIFTKEEKETINLSIIENYLNSNLYKELLKAKEVKRETPFYLNINSGEIYEKTNEPILVQGVIDLYYISEDNKLILVDYKTDYIKDRKMGKEELTEKYKTQLDLYQRALEKSLRRRVDKKYIYSTSLNECVEII